MLCPDLDKLLRLAASTCLLSVCGGSNKRKTVFMQSTLDFYMQISYNLYIIQQEKDDVYDHN